jgi:ribosomal protein S18 acetylase RimI-like enzyme
MLDYWCGNDKHTYVAEINHEVVGTFIIKDNFPGLGSHVANASYMTKPGAFGKGIGRTMAEFSLTEAKRLGYRAMQFNIVVKTNDRAIRLWQKLGFEIKGEIPDAFKHSEKGYTDAYIMWKRL